MVGAMIGSAKRLAFCVTAMAAAIAAAPAGALDAACHAPARIDTPQAGKTPAPGSRIADYRVVFERCENSSHQMRLAIRRMSVEGRTLLLAVEPTALDTTLEDAAFWTCAQTTEDAQASTRFVHAIRIAAASEGFASANSPMLRDPGLVHGEGDGSFVTGDLCPSRRPLDRDFLERLAQTGFRVPVALSVSGLWLVHHAEDFRWLRRQNDSGALDITWVNHSYHHPFDPWLPTERDFLLRPGLDRQAEILEMEKLLLAQGATPSVFFRLPGLIGDRGLLDLLRADHLVTLGTDGWLVFSPPLRPGAILLVHPNGNERAGLSDFARLLAQGKLPRPFRPIREAPQSGNGTATPARTGDL
jgi:hypothetical protein